MDISIIIVSFNTKNLLKKCLVSIFKFFKGINFEVIVVDNASSDDSIQAVRNFDEVRVIQNKKNLGFGTANNQGAKISKGRWLFFLNSDAYLIDNSIAKLLEKLSKNPKIGTVGPLILNENKTIQQSIGFFPNLPKIFYWMSFIDDLPGGELLKPYHLDHDRFYHREQKVDWITGAAMLVKREVFEKIKGFDEKIFLYGEDVDLCYRIEKAGFQIVFSPLAKVIHLGRGSSERLSILAIAGEYKGLLYLYRKYRGALAQFFLQLLLKWGALLRILIFGILLQRKELLKAYWRAFWVN